MYLFTEDRIECCGCGGCQQICPANCISMKLLNDGFHYPILDPEQCVHCSKCVEVCPIHQSKIKHEEQQPLSCFYGWHKDDFIRKKSTSGGTFSAIAGIVLNNNKGSVYGALYDKDWVVRHKGVGTIEGLVQLRQSKYVQSEIGNCFSEIKERLGNDEHVLFCGTPCQVDGLKQFLGKNYSKLVLVDLVCHGVTSPELFKKYIASLEEKFCKRLIKIRFRDKVKKGNIFSIAHTTIVFENGKTKSSECNLYLRAYMEGLLQRPSCASCPYASPTRISDITLGDFWGIERIFPQLTDELRKGISLILANTENGQHFCHQLANDMKIIETDISYAFNGINQQLEKPVEASEKTQKLYQDVLNNGVGRALIKGLGIRYLLVMYFRWCISNIKAYLPNRIYEQLVRIKRLLA